MNTTILTLNGKIDMDTSPMYLKPGDVTMRRNARVSVGSGGDNRVNKAHQGTTAVSRSMPDGINKSVGWCKYEEDNSVIYFNCNSSLNHGIYKFNVHTKKNTLLLMWSGLGFTPDTIVDARVIGDELVWVSKGIEPRIISISRAEQYSNKMPVTGVVWEIDTALKGQIDVVAYETLLDEGTGVINIAVNEDLIIPGVGTDSSHGAINIAVYANDAYSAVTGTITQNN